MAGAVLAPLSAMPALAQTQTRASAQTQSDTPRSARANGKVALVTGSSRGIGAAVAKRLARDGFKVIVNGASNNALGEDIVEEIKSSGGEAVYVQADISSASDVQRLFDASEKAFGGLDVVVNSAGIMRLAPLAKMSDEDFARMMDVNLKGAFYVMREAARRVRDGGRIVTFSSSITQLRSATYGLYAATKSAQEMFAGVLAKEVGARNISVNAIAPGLTDTTLFTDGKTAEQIQGFIQRTPLGRLGEPEDIANVIAALVGPDGGWISGQTIFANGAFV
jgi:3-oxoacyl-[acyl-carrier protein] reductase